jgi:F0F1-type ATP synthase assembly protein I
MPDFNSNTDYVALKSEEDENDCYTLAANPSAKSTKKFNMCCLIVGLLIGFLVQEATLAANVVILEVWGEEFAHSSRSQIILFSLAWSFVTSALAIIMLGFLRALVSNFYLSLPAEARSSEHAENLHNDMVENLEVLFVIGALVGVSLAWVVTDMFLGMKPQVNISLVTLGMALLWCRAVMSCRSRNEGTDKIEDEVEESKEGMTIETRESIMIV